MKLRKIFCSFVFLLAGAAGQMIQYPFTSTCALRGSTVTLPCSFTPRTSFYKDGEEIPLKIIRVLWCKNHEICHGSTPSVFDSDSLTNDPRYQYLGDMEGTCTLRITGVSLTDEATYRFRMEADDSAGHFTNRRGVNVKVVEGLEMRINSSSKVTEFRRGQSVSLQCTASLCTFYHLEVTWRKDGHALSETGPALQLSSLTTKDSGNYTCALKTSSGSRSEPFRLQVEEEEEPSNLFWILGAGFGFLLVLIIIILVFILIKRKRAAAAGSQAAASGGKQPTREDDVYSSILPAEGARHQSSREDEDISYVSVQFRRNKHNKNVEEAADCTIYSSVVTKS